MARFRWASSWLPTSIGSPALVVRRAPDVWSPRLCGTATLRDCIQKFRPGRQVATESATHPADRIAKPVTNYDVHHPVEGACQWPNSHLYGLARGRRLARGPPPWLVAAPFNLGGGGQVRGCDGTGTSGQGWRLGRRRHRRPAHGPSASWHKITPITLPWPGRVPAPSPRAGSLPVTTLATARCCRACRGARGPLWSDNRSVRRSSSFSGGRPHDNRD